MIKFFRKIRQELLTENKPASPARPNGFISGRAGRFNKYLLYAIGEIILVVIGILIALQINNWNENQKLIKLEKKLLGEVKIGLESDHKLISTCIEDHQNFINSQDIIVNWIEKEYEYNDSLIPHFKYTFWTTLFLPKDAPFESLKQFGIRNITNEQLSDQISYLYDFVYEEIIFWQGEYKETSIHFRNTLDEIGFEFLEIAGMRSLDVQPIDPSTLQTNKAYLLNLKMTRSTLDIHTNIKLKNTKIEMEKTISMIDKELNKN